MSIKNCHTQHNEACVNAVRCIEAAERYIKINRHWRQARLSAWQGLLARDIYYCDCVWPACLPDKATTRHKNSSTREHAHPHTQTHSIYHTRTHKRQMKLCLVCWFGFSFKLHVAKAAKTKARAGPGDSLRLQLRRLCSQFVATFNWICS